MDVIEIIKQSCWDCLLNCWIWKVDNSNLSFYFLNKKDALILMNISMATIPLVIMASGIVENQIFFGICYSILSGLITIASVSITTIQQQESIVYNIGKILSSFFVIATIFAPFGGILAAYFNWLLNPRLSLVILGLLSSLLVILIKSYEKKLTKKRTAIFIKEDQWINYHQKK